MRDESSKQQNGPRPQQLGLFGPLDPPPPRVAAAAADDELRRLGAALPAAVALGTSSWAFAGWRGIVYAPDAPTAQLSRHGLGAYANHPLLRAVGLDRTFYAPIATTEFAAYAAQVPDRFRFLVKAWNALTTPRLDGGAPNPHYLDVDRAIDEVLAPAVEGLGAKLGTLVFQFPPQGDEVARAPSAFADRLHTFLTRLPAGAPCAVELRDAALLTRAYVDALAASGVRHGFVVHPRMPSLERQRELVGLAAPVTVRWMLHAGFAYEQAKARYQPFDRIVDGDAGSRGAIATLCRDALALGTSVMVIVNNKAEGSAPQSIRELARVLADADAAR